MFVAFVKLLPARVPDKPSFSPLPIMPKDMCYMGPSYKGTTYILGCGPKVRSFNSCKQHTLCLTR